jgi:hypothetical protein
MSAILHIQDQAQKLRDLGAQLRAARLVNDAAAEAQLMVDAIDTYSDLVATYWTLKAAKERLS